MHLHSIPRWVEQWPGLHMFWHQSLLSEDMQGKSLVLWAYILVRRTIRLWRGRWKWEGGRGEGGLYTTFSLTHKHTHHTYTYTHTRTHVHTLILWLEGEVHIQCMRTEVVRYIRTTYYVHVLYMVYRIIHCL